MSSALTLEVIKSLPKVVLHDHLDGGVRPATIAQLASETGYDKLPTSDPIELAKWFREACESGSLEKYLEAFVHTVGVMQTATAIERVAFEAVEDLANDGVVYAEIRMAPELLQEQGLSLDQIVGEMLAGFKRGEKEMQQNGKRIKVGLLLTAMRTAARSSEIAQLAIKWREQGVVGFDIAGKEAGYPPTRHLDAFDAIRQANFHMTIHAGEAFGLPSIWEAVQICGTDRLGHGVRIVDDITFDEANNPVLGPMAAYVRDRRVPLEMCPSSNVQTGAAKSIKEHPIGLLKNLQFRVTLNTDNRLMSDTFMSKEMYLLVHEAGFTLKELQWLSVNAMKSAFIPFDERLSLINEVIKPGYAQAAKKLEIKF